MSSHRRTLRCQMPSASYLGGPSYSERLSEVLPGQAERYLKVQGPDRWAGISRAGPSAAIVVVSGSGALPASEGCSNVSTNTDLLPATGEGTRRIERFPAHTRPAYIKQAKNITGSAGSLSHGRSPERSDRSRPRLRQVRLRVLAVREPIVSAVCSAAENLPDRDRPAGRVPTGANWSPLQRGRVSGSNALWDGFTRAASREADHRYPQPVDRLVDGGGALALAFGWRSVSSHRTKCMHLRRSFQHCGRIGTPVTHRPRRRRTASRVASPVPGRPGWSEWPDRPAEMYSTGSGPLSRGVEGGLPTAPAPYPHRLPTRSGSRPYRSPDGCVQLHPGAWVDAR